MSIEKARSVRNVRAADELFCQLEKRIRSGELRDGQPLPSEREIVETYGVSRTVVREAVVALANKGLVDARHRHRPLVRKPSFDTAFETVGNVVARLLTQPEGVKNLFDSRILIEAALVRHAATEADRDAIRELVNALEANKTAIPDSERFFRTDVAFHAVFYRIPGNPLLPAIHRAYTGWLAPHWSRMPGRTGRNEANYEAHKAILDAILLRDPDLSEQALRTHLADAWTQVCQTF